MYKDDIVQFLSICYKSNFRFRICVSYLHYLRKSVQARVSCVLPHSGFQGNKFTNHISIQHIDIGVTYWPCMATKVCKVTFQFTYILKYMCFVLTNINWRSTDLWFRFLGCSRLVKFTLNQSIKCAKWIAVFSVETGNWNHW